MTVLPLIGPHRQCHTCGKVLNLNRMLYIKEMWFCNATCHQEGTTNVTFSHPTRPPRDVSQR